MADETLPANPTSLLIRATGGDDNTAAPTGTTALFTGLAPEPNPTKGRIVFYHSVIHDEVVSLAALVVKVWSPTCVNLKVFGEDGGDFFVFSVSKATIPGAAGGWSYPPRV